MSVHAQLVTASDSAREQFDGPCWAQIVPTNLDALGASFLQLKQSTIELERIAAQLAAGDAIDR